MKLKRTFGSVALHAIDVPDWPNCRLSDREFFIWLRPGPTSRTPGKDWNCDQGWFYAPLRNWTKAEIEEALSYLDIEVPKIGEAPVREGCKLKHLLKLWPNLPITDIRLRFQMRFCWMN